MSTFDSAAFLSETTTEALDTRLTPVPPGEYSAMISKIEGRQTPNKNDPSQVYTIVDITYLIDDQSVKEATGLDQPTVRQSLFLDMNDAGKLDTGKGKNVGLGRLREATGLNKPGEPFSFDMLMNQPVHILVEQTPDKNDSSIIYSNVKRVGAVA